MISGKRTGFCELKNVRETHGKYIIGTYSHKNLFIPSARILCNGMYQFSCCRIRIKSHSICIHLPQRLLHSRCRRIRILVGIQLDHIRLIGLLAWCIWYLRIFSSHLLIYLIPFMFLLFFTFVSITLISIFVNQLFAFY